MNERMNERKFKTFYSASLLILTMSEPHLSHLERAHAAKLKGASHSMSDLHHPEVLLRFQSSTKEPDDYGGWDRPKRQVFVPLGRGQLKPGTAETEEGSSMCADAGHKCYGLYIYDAEGCVFESHSGR